MLSSIVAVVTLCKPCLRGFISRSYRRNPDVLLSVVGWSFVGENIDFVVGGEVAALPDFRARLTELAMPTLILAGRFDRALYPKLQMEFKRRCPQAQFTMLEKSGTWGHLEEPETVMALLRAFLEPLDQDTRP